jgi:hypothetical protein
MKTISEPATPDAAAWDERSTRLGKAADTAVNMPNREDIGVLIDEGTQTNGFIFLTFSLFAALLVHVLLIISKPV